MKPLTPQLYEEFMRTRNESRMVFKEIRSDVFKKTASFVSSSANKIKTLTKDVFQKLK